MAVDQPRDDNDEEVKQVGEGNGDYQMILDPEDSKPTTIPCVDCTKR